MREDIIQENLKGYVPQEMIDRFIHNEKLRNELERTHEFYNESGNGFCAGVTYQILTLSNYGGYEKKPTNAEKCD